MKNMLKVLLVALMLGFAAIQPGVCAPQAKTTVKPQAKPTVAAEVNIEENSDESDLKQISARLAEIEQEINAKSFTRQSLEDDLSFLSNAEIRLEAVIRKLEKESAYAQDALAAFGEAPAEGEEEDAAIAEKREKYSSEVSAYKGKLIEANLLLTETARITALTNEARSQVMIGNLVAEKNLLIVPSTFWQATRDAAVFFWQLTISPVQWFKNLTDEGRAEFFNHIWYVLLVFGVAMSFGLWLRLYIIRRWGYSRQVDHPRYGQKVGVAIITALAYGVIPSLLIGGCLLWEVANQELLESQFGRVLAHLLFTALWVTLSMATMRVILAPWNGKWRLFNISDLLANKVFKAVSGVLILLGVMAFLIHVAEYFDASNALNLLLNVANDTAKALSIIWVTASVFGEVRADHEQEVLESGQVADDNVSEGLSRGAKVILFMSLFALGTLGVSLFGYPDLASFIFNRFFASVVLLGVFAVIRLIISDILRRSVVFCFSTFKLRRKLLSKADFLMSLLITPILVMFVIYSLLRLWGVSASFMLYGIKKLIFGFKVGGIQISLIAILTGLLVFVISLSVVKILKNKLSNSLLTRINMDEGIKHSLVSGVSFIGFIISAILAVVAMGVDLSNLAVIAGALSVGIGFGLQDVIKNLVSGIIILFERPFKVGDWVILAGEEGKIKQINIRSTELETWTRRSVIIPNATLISSSLVNLTHGDTWQRQSIVVGVSYDSDVELVTKLLIDCAKANKRVVKVPAPVVVFKDFGASSLDFELRFHVADVRVDFVASSELRYAILKTFRENGIEIAYPQVVVHQGQD